MKNLILFIFLCFSLNAISQVHIKNQRYLQANFGSYDHVSPFQNQNFSLNIEMGKYNKKLNSRAVGFLYARKLSSNAIPVERATISFKQELNVYSSANLTKTFKFLGLAFGGYESINRDKSFFGSESIATKSSLLIGLGLGCEYEITPFVLGYRASYSFSSNYQKIYNNPYLGIKIHL